MRSDPASPAEPVCPDSLSERSDSPVERSGAPEIPRLRIVREIGAGPRGRVYEATDGRRRLAVKVFPRGGDVDPEVLGRFVRTSPHRIRHPNLSPVESVGSLPDGAVYVVQPLQAGDCLAQILRDLERGATDHPSLSPLSVGPAGEVHPELPWCAAEVLAGAADGLGRAHREGIVHGRVGPGNLHLSPAGRLVVSDFGAVPSDEAAGRDADFRFRAPEQLRDPSSRPSPTADVYALGAVLRELVTRRRITATADPAAFLEELDRKGLTSPREVRPELPAQLAACILRAMDPDPEARYPEGSELARDLLGFARREAAAPRPDRAPAPARKEPPAPPRVAEIPIAESPLPEASAPSREGATAASAVPRAHGGTRRAAARRPGASAPTGTAVPPPAAEGLGAASPVAAPAPDRRRVHRGLVARVLRSSATRRVAAAAALLASLGLAWVGGERLWAERAVRKQAKVVASFVARGEYDAAIEGTTKLEALDPGGHSARLLEEYASSAAALSALRTAVRELDGERPTEAAVAALEATRFRPHDSELESLATRLVTRTMEDAIERDLVDPMPSLRASALRRLELEISSGSRPRSDAGLALRALYPPDPLVTRQAIPTLAMLGSAELLLGLRIVEGEPCVTLDGASFDLLCSVLERSLDPAAAAFLCAIDLEACESLDGTPAPCSAALPPNIRLELGAEGPRGFRARWIWVTSRVDHPALLAGWRRLAADPQLASGLVAALELVGTGDAEEALASLARDGWLNAGEAAASALARMGAYWRLVELLRSELPRAYRERILDLVGESFSGLCVPELAQLALRSPEPAIRRRAFEFLDRHDEPAAVGTIPAAAGDPVLKALAMEWLDRLPAEVAAPLALRLVAHPDRSVRAQATVHLASLPAGLDSASLALGLLSSSADARESAATVLLWREEVLWVPRVLGKVFHVSSSSVPELRSAEIPAPPAGPTVAEHVRAALRAAGERLLAAWESASSAVRGASDVAWD